MNDEVKRCAQKPSQYVNGNPLQALRKTMKNVRTDGLRVEIWIRDHPNTNQYYYTLHLTFGCELQRAVKNFITAYHIAPTRNNIPITSCTRLSAQKQLYSRAPLGVSNVHPIANLGKQRVTYVKCSVTVGTLPGYCCWWWWWWWWWCRCWWWGDEDGTGDGGSDLRLGGDCCIYSRLYWWWWWYSIVTYVFRSPMETNLQCIN